MKILVTGYFERGNLGDNLMLAGLKRLVNEIGSPSGVVYEAMPPLRVRGLLGALRFLWLTYEARWLVLCGGTHFHDLSGMRGTKTLCAHLILYVFAGLVRTRIMLLGVGVEQPTTRVGRILIGGILRRAAIIVPRDSESAEICVELKAQHVSRGEWDLALLAQGDIANIGRRIGSSERKGRRLGINVTPLSNGAPGSATYDDIVEWLVGGVGAIEPQVNLVTLCVNNQASDDEVERTQMLAEKIGCDASPSLDCVEDAVRAFRGCDFLIVMRFHAALLGYMLDKPMLFIPYQRKCAVLAQQMQLPSHAILERDVCDSKEIAQRVKRLVDEPENFRAMRDKSEWEEIAWKEYYAAWRELD